MSARAWLQGARIRTLPASVGPVLVGGGLAWSAGRFAPLPFAAALAGALLLQVGTNYANDYSDFLRGADGENRMGAPRVTQTGQLGPGAVRRGAGICFALAVLVGLYLAWRGGWPVVAIGVASILAGIGYTGGPWPFGYHGLGDLFTFVFFGPVAVAGTYYVQALAWGLPDTLLAGTGMGAVTTAILVVNNLRDRATDRAAGKRTLSVLIGARATRIEYAALLLAAAAVPAVGVARLDWPAGVLLASLALLPLVPAARLVWTYRDPRALNAALARTAGICGLYGLGFGIGTLW